MTHMPKGSGAVRCLDCGVVARADGKGTPIVLKHLANCPVNANLGLATTRMLLNELRARADITEIMLRGSPGQVYAISLSREMRLLLENLPEEMLRYRTVDS